MIKTHKALSAVVAVAGVLLLSACAPDSGYIHDRSYDPPHSSTTMQCYSRDAKTGTCTFSMPVTHNYPASYRFDLYNGDDHGWVEVDEYAYNNYGVGDFYDTNS